MIYGAAIHYCFNGEAIDRAFCVHPLLLWCGISFCFYGALIHLSYGTDIRVLLWFERPLWLWLRERPC